MATLSGTDAGARRPDRRPAKSSEALRRAFLDLLFSGPYEDITMAAIAERADVARSTLYQHFRSKEEVLVATMAHLLDILADAATGRGDAARLDSVLAHFWENRRLARSVFGPPVDVIVRQALAERIEARTDPAGPGAGLDAAYVAGGQTALLYAWLTARASASRAEVARCITASTPPGPAGNSPSPCDLAGPRVFP